MSTDPNYSDQRHGLNESSEEVTFVRQSNVDQLDPQHSIPAPAIKMVSSTCEDAFKHDSGDQTKANKQEQSPKSRGIFSVNLLPKNPFLAQTTKGIRHTKDEDHSNPINTPLNYPASHPYSRFPQLRPEPQDEDEPLIQPVPQVSTEQDVGLLKTQVYKADTAAEFVKRSGRYPDGFNADRMWLDHFPHPEDTKFGQGIIKWLADIETPERESDDREFPATSPGSDHPSENAYDTNPRDASVAGVGLGLGDVDLTLPDINPGEAAHMEPDQDNSMRFTNGREHKSAHEACCEIYGMLSWMTHMNDTRRPMAAQMQPRSGRQMMTTRRGPATPTPTPTHTWTEARRDAMRAVGGVDTRGTTICDDLWRRRRGGSGR